MAKKATAKTSTGKHVTVRMYCQGLGDCFLLTFPRKSGPRKEFHILVDCGVIVGQPDGPAKIRQVATDLAERTDKHIDVLVATHEHWDHLSGFVDAEPIFSQIQFDQVWLSWMENPDEPLARELQQDRDARKKKLAMALNRPELQLALGGDSPEADSARQLASVAGFFGLEPGDPVPPMGLDGEEVDRGKTGKALNFVGSCAGDNTWYLKPSSDSMKLEELPGVEFFVLGPPWNEDPEVTRKAIKKDKPTKKGQETFPEEEKEKRRLGDDAGHEHDHDELTPLAALDLPSEATEAQGYALPFDDRYGVAQEEALDDPFYRRMYDDGTDDSHPCEWRRIDDVWMYGASEFALQLDSITNNTSLALAIRLPNDKVMLFPGDAQVGNWESWHWREYQWTKDKKVSAEVLLNHTVLYKVGHHGSHNATLREKGLMMMTNPKLVAMLPVDEDVAHNKKGWCEMPFPPMLEELKSRTKGHILRPDHDQKHPETDLAKGEEITWTPSTQEVDGIPGRHLYLEYTLPLN